MIKDDSCLFGFVLCVNYFIVIDPYIPPCRSGWAPEALRHYSFIQLSEVRCHGENKNYGKYHNHGHFITYTVTPAMRST